MEQQTNSSTIDDVAADWVARLEKGSVSDSDKAVFEAWLQADVRHRGAWARAQAIFAAVGETGDVSSVPASSAGTQVSRRHAVWFAGGAAAAAVAVASIGLGLSMRAVHYQTRRGEVRLLPLEDGSAVTLNTDSEIAVRFRRAEREITLLKGEALFDVMRDPKRPFTVTMGDTVVRAVGTSFVVQNLLSRPAQVMVSEGAVDMFRASLGDQQAIRVPARARAVALEIPTPSVKLVDMALDDAAMARQLAWRQGMVAFEGETLRNAAAEFNRYSDTQIVVDDPTIAGRTVTGLFSIHNPVGFARSVALSLGLKVEVAEAKVMIWK